MDNMNINELFTTKLCSPLLAFGIVAVISGVSLYNTRTKLANLNSNKISNLSELHTYNEIILLVVVGVVLFGMCQYNQVYLAWVFMFLPVLYLVVKNLMIFLYVSVAYQNSPKPVVANTLQQNYGVPPALQQAMQQAVQQNTVQQPVNKTVNLSPPLSTSIQGLANSNMNAPLGQSDGGNFSQF